MAQEAVKKQTTQEVTNKNNNEIFCVQKLFGGAFEISLPKRFIDLSNFRLVPDHQEVWSDAYTDQSIIVELVEMVTEQKDENASKYHYNDIAETSNSIETKIISSGIFESNSGFEVAKKYHCSWTFGTQKVSKGRDSNDKSNIIALYLVLIRLKEFGTDLLITFNAPIKIHDESQAKSAKNAVKPPQVTIQLFQKIVSTFKIKNLSIFGQQ
eukprot:191382_1